MKQSIQALREKFKSGAKPSADDFADLLDSFVHIDSQTAVNGTIVDQKLNAYAQSQQSGNSDGRVNTVGDLYTICLGLDDKPGIIKQTLDLLVWEKIPSRPNRLDLTWTEQTFITDTTVFDPQPSQTPTSANTSRNPAEAWLLSGLGRLSGKYLIIDIYIARRWTSTPNAYMDVITAVKVAVQPRAITYGS